MIIRINFILLIFLFVFTLASAQTTSEDITITTYYPSPYGSYNQLQTNTLGVGDNDGDGALDNGDVPTTTGDVWIAGNVGIGTTNPTATLQLNGTASIFGMWQTRNAATEYTAPTDGFVVAYDSNRVCIEGYTPSTTVRARAHTITDNESITFPVRKGDTWKVIASDCAMSGETPNTTVYWLPIGN